MEPLSIAVRAMDKIGMLVGKRVLVSGGGPIGLLCAQLAAKYGAAELTLSEPVANRCEIAKKIGVEHIVNPITEDLYERAMEITNGIGYDVILECSAVPSAATSVLKCTPQNMPTSCMWRSIPVNYETAAEFVRVLLHAAGEHHRHVLLALQLRADGGISEIRRSVRVYQQTSRCTTLTT